MGLFKDLRNLRKQTKALRRQSDEQGVDTSIRGLLSSAPGLLSQAGQALQQVQSGKAESDRLRAEGIPGRARLLAIRDTGMTIGGTSLGMSGEKNPVAELDLEITVGSDQPYRTTIRQMVPRLSVGRLIPGSDLPVKVDPRDGSNALVDWEAPLPGPGPA